MQAVRDVEKKCKFGIMKLVTFEYADGTELGLIHESTIYRLKQIDPSLPTDMLTLLKGGEERLNQVRQMDQDIKNRGSRRSAHAVSTLYTEAGIPESAVRLLAPLPNPGSCRDAYAFRQHVETSRANRGLAMIPEFDEFPVFYFTNHRAIHGPGDVYGMPRQFEQLDFELEVAVVLHKQGRNIPAAEADQYIAGFMIMNDLSARRLQMEEMKLNLGPAKGKDFSTVLGPWLVTPDELTPYLVPPRPGRKGLIYDLSMSCRVNGVEVSRGSMADMHWSFAEIIERVSYGVDVYPGDVIGSGTVGTGCFLELNGTGKRANPDHFTEQWLEPGDIIELEVTGLGILKTQVWMHESV